MKSNHSIIYLFLILLFISSCKEDEIIIELDDTPYVLVTTGLPNPTIPEDNMLTVQGVKLGRMLFYEEMLSKDGTQSCSTCHNQPDGFSDTLQFSVGVEKMQGKRQAMPIFNMAYHSNEFFWDGRAHLLRDQALLPIQDPLEMNEELKNVVAKLKASQTYKDQFTRAFGSDEITTDLIALAIEQFELSIISNNSKYDQYLAGTTTLTASEERGRILFEKEFNPFFPNQSGADCAHCHGGRNFENDDYMNNGLDNELDIKDIGREKVTENTADKGKFKVPSLRNIAVTGPYMHDGRFTTLEEVVDHYNSGIHNAPTTHPALVATINTGLFLTQENKEDLIHFLHTLTDETYLNNPAYKTPF